MRGGRKIKPRDDDFAVFLAPGSEGGGWGTEGKRAREQNAGSLGVDSALDGGGDWLLMARGYLREPKRSSCARHKQGPDGGSSKVMTKLEKCP